ncbi:hypothetical protein SAMN02745121_03327 [Nannocystis exedens]|uniref:Uncharacterized protein n=1 Tax=Nannocystis exedens TaxID=54 RepID=A0A1I1YII9_9BACT|nr:hypothetical protein [Nannocystis exedens]PCC70344.1 hypothetical protein NAEX_03387 [Nannocystis exedens]SFE19367.1 hypothetical protein SAMN02745121_03327 [Nannocystis exedens]
MMLFPVFLAVVLSPGPAETPAEPWQVHAAECQRRKAAGEHAKAGDACRRAFEAVPERPESFDQRSLLAFSAVRLYKKAHKASYDVAPLCNAAALLRTFEAQLATLPPADRPGDRAGVADALREIEPRIAGMCTDASPDDLVAVGRPAGKPKTDPPASPAQMPAAVVVQPARPAMTSKTDRPSIRSGERRPLRIAGLTTLGVGLALGGGAIAMLVRGAAMDVQVDSLNATYPASTMIPHAEAQRFHDLTRQGERANDLALGLGVPALALFISGVTLLGIDAHQRRTDRRFAVHPGPAGLRLTMEF